MPRGSFNYWFQRAEHRYRGRPRALVAAVAWSAALGWTALWAALVGGLLATVAACLWAVADPGLLSGGVTLAVGVTSLAGLWIGLGAIIVPGPAEHGVLLDPGDSPAWRGWMEELGLREVEVRVDASLRLEVIDRPGRGFLDSGGRWLRVGLPLLELLDEEEFRLLAQRAVAVRGLGDGSARLVLLWKRWRQVVEIIHRDPGREVLKRFLAVYWPRFSSRAVLLARVDEEARDREVDSALLAAVLKRVAIARFRRRDHWAALTGTGVAQPVSAYGAMYRPAGDSWDRVKEKSWLSEAVAAPPGRFETEPALASRLDALGADPSLVPPRRSGGFVAAGDAMIDPGTLREVREEIEQRCQRETEAEWQRANRGFRADEPNGTPSRFLTVRQRWRRISDLLRVDGLESVQEEIEALLGEVPDHSGALFLRGRHRAKLGDPSARGDFEGAASDPTLRGEAFGALARLEAGAGRDGESTRFRRLAIEHEQEMRLALVERHRLGAGDRFLPAGLAPDAVGELCGHLHAESVVQEAWLVAKQVEHFPEWHHHVLVVRIEWPSHSMIPNRDETQLLERLARSARADGHLHACSADKVDPRIMRTIRRRVPGSAIYRRRSMRGA